MRKYILALILTITYNSAFSQYVAFFKFETDDPATVVSTMTDLMNSNYGKTIPAKVNLFGTLFNAEDTSTHAVTFDFMNEDDLNTWLNEWAVSKEAQLFNSKLQTVLEGVSEYVATPVAYNGKDWSPDRVFMFWNMDITNPAKYVKEWTAFTKKYEAKYGSTGSLGIGMPIVGQSDFSHFVWSGGPDVATALKQLKKMYSDPLFSEYAKNVASIRKVKSTYMMQRLITFN
tara:strand:- start:818 stop:1507 length:690 start_codon:yes stop_codon:yes gene_type:complete